MRIRPPGRRRGSRRAGGRWSAGGELLHLSWSEIPCPGRSDLLASARLSSAQELVVPWTRNEETWVMVEADELAGDTNEVMLLLRLEDLIFEEMSASFAGCGRDPTPDRNEAGDLGCAQFPAPSCGAP